MICNFVFWNYRVSSTDACCFEESKIYDIYQKYNTDTSKSAFISSVRSTYFTEGFGCRLVTENFLTVF
jgi:hypothetical protein